MLMPVQIFLEIYIFAKYRLDEIIPAAVGAAPKALERAFVGLEIESPEIRDLALVGRGALRTGFCCDLTCATDSGLYIVFF